MIRFSRVHYSEVFNSLLVPDNFKDYKDDDVDTTQR
jgi:hypothetical protein